MNSMQSKFSQFGNCDTSKLKKLRYAILSVVVVLALSFLCGCAQGASNQASQIPVTQDTEVTGLQHHDGYELEQMTLVSRHNVRSPISKPDAVMNTATTHQWFNWTSNFGELSLKGGLSETSVGQYFRKFLERENFIPQNWVPSGDEVYVYANSMQRTIATAAYFITGMIPVADVNVNHKYAIEKKDGVFAPLLPQVNDALIAKFNKEANESSGENGIQTRVDNLEPNFRLLEDTIDFKDSKYAQEKNVDSMTEGDSYLKYEAGTEPALYGPIRLGNDLVDPMKMQYYEEEDDSKATFGKNLSYDDMKRLGQISDAYFKVTYTGHTISTQVMHQMLLELNQDINNTNRKFTFLCGHDTTIIPTLYALDCEPYELPNTISTMAPIGAKIVFAKYKDAAGEEYINVNLVYETTDQIRHKAILNTDNPPMAYEVSFKGLEKNSDGMYKLTDFQNRLNQSIADYDNY